MKILKIAVLSLILSFSLLSNASLAASLVKETLRIETRPQHSFPKVGQYEVLACDFHMHTPYSDGAISPRERVLEAYRQGYDAIAITDHGKTDAYKDAIDLAKALGIVLIRSFETGIKDNEHLVVLGAPEGYVPVNAHSWAEKKGEPTAFYQDQLESIAKFGGVVILAHPHVGYREPVIWAIKHGLIQAVEVKNGVVGSGWNTVLSHGTYCYPAAFDFALENKLAMLADTDSHSARAADSEISYVLVKKRNAEGVLEGIRAGRSVACFSGMIWGAPDLLKDIFRASVNISEAVDVSSGEKCVFIQNRSPAALKVNLQTGSTIDIAPYQEVMVPVSASSKAAPIVFENIWTNLKDNLKFSDIVKPVSKKLTAGQINF